MPIYEYQCKKCGHRFEKIQKHSDPEIRKCPECGGAVEKLITAAAAHFKGDGWYVTDYARKGAGEKKSASGDGDSSAAAAKDAKAEPKAESKAETKAEHKSEKKPHKR